MDNEISLKIGEALQEWAQNRVDNATKLLNDQKIPYGSLLSQSIQTTALKIDGSSVEIGLTANDYYMFIDQGVKGLSPKFNKRNSGLFKFKTPYPSRAMIQSLNDYIPRYRKVPKSPKGKSVTIPKKEQLAVQMAFIIKQVGIKQKPFWTPTFNEAAYNDLAARIEAKLETQIELTLTIE